MKDVKFVEKYCISGVFSSEVYADGKFIDLYDGEKFTLFDSEEEAEKVLKNLNNSDELEIKPIDVYKNLWIHRSQDMNLKDIPEEDSIISDQFAVITSRKYYENADVAEGYFTDWAGNPFYCVVS